MHDFVVALAHNKAFVSEKLLRLFVSAERPEIDSALAVHHGSAAPAVACVIVGLVNLDHRYTLVEDNLCRIDVT